MGRRAVAPFLCYLDARVAQDEEDYIYRVYVTESLRLHGENKYLTKSWGDMLKPQKRDERSAEEIITSVLRNGGLTLKEGGGKGVVVHDPAGEADAGQQRV